MRSLLSQRSYLRCLSEANRRKWFEQRQIYKSPRVAISIIPRVVSRSYSYVSVSHGN